MSRFVRIDRLAGLAELASLLNAKKQTVDNWKNRYDDFPKPVTKLEATPVWDSTKVLAWAKRKAKV